MPSEPIAFSPAPPARSGEDEYDAICSAMAATARGRWFLEEYARRNRDCDTTQVLDAIERMEATVLEQRARQASQEVRLELLEMARTIARARGDVSEGRAPKRPVAEPEPSPAAPEIAAVAERLRQIAWTVRACGIDLPLCDQIGDIAETLLSAGTLRNLGDRQTQNLTEVLHYLERRIDRMLDGEAAGAPPVDPTASRPRQTRTLDPADDEFPLALTDMTPANTNVAEAAPRVTLTSPPAFVEDVTTPVAGSSTAEIAAQDDPIFTEASVAAEPSIPPSVEPAALLTTEPAAPTVEAATLPTTEPSPPVAEAARPTAESTPTVASLTAETTEPPSAAIEPTPAAAPVIVSASPTPEAPRNTAPSNPIAAQVDLDLNDLTDVAPARGRAHDTAISAAQPAAEIALPPAPQLPQPDVSTVVEEDPADFLLEALPEKPAASAASSPPPAQAGIAEQKLQGPQMSTVLAAIATELLAESHADERARPLVISGALALLMTMSEEERIALFS